MKNILLEIRMLKEGTEKDFLQKTFYDVKKYIKAKDEQALKVIISRLNGLYPGMSDKARDISLMVVNEIMEAEKKK